MVLETLEALEQRLMGTVRFENGVFVVAAGAAFAGPLTDDLIETAVFAADIKVKARARFILKSAGRELGIPLASVHDLYGAMGRGEVTGMTVPAMNIRGLSYDTARAFFRAAKSQDCGAYLFEIAKSEIGYTDQRPSEYVAVMMAAALREGFRGPLFIQGDHFQTSAKAFAADPRAEVESIRALIREAVAAGFYNIDIDSSTLVVLERNGLAAQQKDNAEVCAALTRYIRQVEPQGTTISVGGEIGEVGTQNSTVEEFRAFMSQYLPAVGGDAPIRKISVQTGTSHGGLVLPDGTVAQVKLDFNVLSSITEVARKEYGLGGTVQHGASTLPDEAFHQFPAHGACEVHLATGFQNMLFDNTTLPADFKAHVYAHLQATCASERKASDSDEQFFYKVRKKGFGGALKREWWGLPSGVREELGAALEKKFAFLIGQLGAAGSRELVAKYVKAAPPIPHIVLEEAAISGKLAEIKDDGNPLAD